MIMVFREILQESESVIKAHSGTHVKNEKINYNLFPVDIDRREEGCAACPLWTSCSTKFETTLLTTYMSNTFARCPMEKSKGHWTFHMSNGSNGPPIFHWTFACPLDPMDKWNVHWPAMESELCINRIRDHVKVADRNNASTG
jgi:hypothetical protein